MEEIDSKSDFSNIKQSPDQANLSDTFETALLTNGLLSLTAETDREREIQRFQDYIKSPSPSVSNVLGSLPETIIAPAAIASPALYKWGKEIKDVREIRNILPDQVPIDKAHLPKFTANALKFAALAGVGLLASVGEAYTIAETNLLKDSTNKIKLGSSEKQDVENALASSLSDTTNKVLGEALLFGVAGYASANIFSKNWLAKGAGVLVGSLGGLHYAYRDFENSFYKAKNLYTKLAKGLPQEI